MKDLMGVVISVFISALYSARVRLTFRNQTFEDQVVLVLLYQTEIEMKILQKVIKYIEIK
jgi:hypothetical protein